jgi:hypothetical protein
MVHVGSGYWYKLFGSWFMHSLMVQVEVQVGAWLMHLFMVQVDVWYMLAHVIGTGCYRLIKILLVQVYNGISHSDSVTMVPSFYFYVGVVGQGNDRWL